MIVLSISFMARCHFYKGSSWCFLLGCRFVPSGGGNNQVLFGNRTKTKTPTKVMLPFNCLNLRFHSWNNTAASLLESPRSKPWRWPKLGAVLFILFGTVNCGLILDWVLTDWQGDYWRALVFYRISLWSFLLQLLRSGIIDKYDHAYVRVLI